MGEEKFDRVEEKLLKIERHLTEMHDSDQIFNEGIEDAQGDFLSYTPEAQELLGTATELEDEWVSYYKKDFKARNPDHGIEVLKKRMDMRRKAQIPSSIETVKAELFNRKRKTTGGGAEDKTPKQSTKKAKRAKKETTEQPKIEVKEPKQEIKDDKEELVFCPECSVQYIEGVDMVACDRCDNWFHYECANLTTAPLENEPWYCKQCVEAVDNGKITAEEGGPHERDSGVDLTQPVETVDDYKEANHIPVLDDHLETQVAAETPNFDPESEDKEMKMDGDQPDYDDEVSAEISELDAKTPETSDEELDENTDDDGENE